jgi:PIN domain nuclease of toxin-antitoxin system
VLLWALEGDLAPEAAELVSDGADVVMVSAASIWEAGIKHALGKLRPPATLVELVDESGFDRLLVTFEHALEAGGLPLHHGDPFDRMLVAQARVEGLTLATADPQISRYDVPVLEVRPA